MAYLDLYGSHLSADYSAFCQCYTPRSPDYRSDVGVSIVVEFYLRVPLINMVDRSEGRQLALIALVTLLLYSQLLQAGSADLIVHFEVIVSDNVAILS